jgi:ABC-type polysaccharide/polyol phosphate export permease
MIDLTYALREYRYWLTRYRRTWRSTIVIGVVNPLLFLVAVGVGLGGLVHRGNPALGGVPYLAFFAPGMLAAAAMQNGVVESSFPVSRARSASGSYQVAVATPLEPEDILIGHVLFMATRIAVNAAVFLAVLVAFGAARSGLVILDLPAAILTGLAFALPVSAWAVTKVEPGQLAGIFKWVVMPLYLFSGTFFAVDQLPGWVRPLVWLTPSWHGVQLCRTLSLGTATGAGVLIHVGYLSAVIGLGFIVARRAYGRCLQP